MRLIDPQSLVNDAVWSDAYDDYVVPTRAINAAAKVACNRCLHWAKIYNQDFGDCRQGVRVLDYVRGDFGCVHFVNNDTESPHEGG